MINMTAFQSETEIKAGMIMRKKADLKRQRKIGSSVAFLFGFILISIYLWDFSVSAMTLEQTKSRDNLSELAVQGATIVEHKIKGASSVLWV